MKKITALLLAPLCGAFLLSPAQAQKTKAQLTTEVSITFPDNTMGSITPLGVRTFQIDLINSIMPTAPVVSGNLACFNGATGLLQDCGLAPNSLIVGTTNIAVGSNGNILYNNSGKLGEYTPSGSGSVVMSSGASISGATISTSSINCASNTCSVRLGSDVTGQLPVANGGTGSSTQSGAASNIFPTPTRAGDIAYWNGSNWVTLPGNNSGTVFLQENSSGAPSWASGAGVTSLNGQTGAVRFTLPPEGRLTLTSVTPVTTTDVTGATTVYYTPYIGRIVPIYDGTNFVPTDLGGELSVALGSNWTTNTNYDWFIGLNASVPTLCSGPSWNAGAVAGSDTARGTGAGSTDLDFVQGVYLNKNSMTCNTSNSTSFTCAADRCTYLGSTRTVAAGQTEDSLLKRFVYNAYNQTLRTMLRQEGTSSWTWSTASYHQVNAAAANQISYFAGLTGSAVRAVAQCIPLNSTTSIVIVYCGIGLNSTTVNSKTMGDFCRIANGTVPSCSPKAFYDGFVALGLTNLVWLEKGGGTADTQTFFGNGGGTDFQAAITGEIFQ